MFSDDVEKEEERRDESRNSESEEESEEEHDDYLYEVPDEKLRVPPPRARQGSGGLTQKPLSQSTANGDEYDQYNAPREHQTLHRPNSAGGLTTSRRPTNPSRTPSQQGTPRQKSRQQPEVNEEFRDVQSSGQWGKISRMEMIIGAVVVLVVVAGAITGIVIVTGNKGSDASNAQTTPLPTLAPSLQPEVDPEDQLVSLLDAMDTVNISTMFFPSDASYFTPNLVANTTRLPSIRAMAWVLNMDPRDSLPDNPWLIFRYALASIYYSFRGENWTNSENWLTGEHACKWHGVICDRSQASYVFELDLSNNNVVGTIPIQISLLSDLRSLILTGNKLTGTIPSVRLGNMRNLSLLYLNENQLTGDLSDLSTLNANNVLSTLLIQENNITGRWPRDFCPRAGEGPVFIEFSLDCYDETACLCCEGNNCF